MYIEQLINKHKSLWLYLPPSLGLILLVIIDNFFTTGDATKILQDMIDTLGKNLTLALLMGQMAFFLVLLIIWVKFAQEQSLTSFTTSRAKIDWRRVLFSFILWGAISASFILVDFFVNPDNYVLNFELNNFLILLIIAIVLVPLQTSFEEYLFRAHIMQGLGLATRQRLIPLIVSSVLFGLMHIANPEVAKLGLIVMVYYIGTGFFLGIITLMDEGLELALGFHAANNLVAALLVTSDWSVLQTHAILKSIAEPSAGLEIVLPIFVIFPLLLMLFSKIYKWKNWQQKLFGKINENFS
jgi:membrane protease YdiL (CAAX protease family)